VRRGDSLVGLRDSIVRRRLSVWDGVERWA
jgi:hypothetical protein